MRAALAAGLLDKFKLRAKISTGACQLARTRSSAVEWRPRTAYGKPAQHATHKLRAGSSWHDVTPSARPLLPCQAT